MFDDLLQTIVDGGLQTCALARVDQALAHADDRLDAVGVGRKFGDESLVLLTLALKHGKSTP